MRSKLSAAAGFSALLIFCPAFAQTLGPAENARSSIVYIYFDVTDANTGAKSLTTGTGFVISASGYLLTASHLFQAWQAQSAVDKSRNPIRGSLRDKPEEGGEGPYRLSLVNSGNPDAEDVALLKLPQPSSDKTYPTAKLCFSEVGNKLKIGEEFVAFGFPFNKNFQPVPGVLGTQNAEGGRWGAVSAFTYGMSGGPVYTKTGFVMGIVKGGLPDTDAVRWITPIEHARNFVNLASVTGECRGQSTSAPDQLGSLSQEKLTKIVRAAIEKATKGECSSDLMAGLLLSACKAQAGANSSAFSQLGEIKQIRPEGWLATSSGAGFSFMVEFERGEQRWLARTNTEGKLSAFWTE